MTYAALAKIGRRHPLRVALDDLLTRCFYSAAGYVFECDPYVVPEDDELLRAFASIREDDRRHAHVLGSLVQGIGGVPGTGVFPWWNLDLNYLTVPCLGRFVVDAIEHELSLYAALIAKWPAEDAGSRAALESILADKRGHVAALRPVAEAATKREDDEGKAKIRAITNARNARLAKEKAAKEAARKAAAAAKAAPGAKPAAAVAAKPAAGLLDPKEPGISSKEKGRRTVLKMRAAMGIGAPSSPAPSGPAPAPVPAPAPGAAAAAALLDPNEPGISPKEKAKRQIAKQRAGSAPAAAPAAAAPVAAPAGAELLDPNEPGISPKEKAKRQIAKQRASAAPASAPPVPVPVPAPGSALAAAASALPEDLGDPDEPGLLPKEKARRQIARIRAKKASGG